jgi:hypothetical protein
LSPLFVVLVADPMFKLNMGVEASRVVESPLKNSEVENILYGAATKRSHEVFSLKSNIILG